MAADARARHGEALDIAATYLAAVVGPGFFERVVLADNVVFSLADHDDLSPPEMSGTASGSAVKGIENFPAQQVRDRLAAVAKAPFTDHRWLATPAHWYLQARLTDDKWKQFLWAFLALEVLAHRVAREHYGLIRARLRLADDAAIAGSGTALRALSVPDPQRLTLLGKFATAAIALSPQTADDDVSTFHTATKARNRLAHGDIRDVAELPTAATVGLLDRYIRLAISRRLDDTHRRGTSAP